MNKKTDSTTFADYGFIASQMLSNVFTSLGTSTLGLDEIGVEKSREKYGSNIISYGRKTPFIIQVFKAYITPFTLVLIVLCIISFITDYIIPKPKNKDLFGVTIISSMIILSGTMTLIQSVKSSNAAAKLKSLVKVTAAVKRNGNFKEIPMEDIVIGDIVKLSAGDMIPADIRLISCKDLFISQSALTGESYPVEKFAKDTTSNIDTETSYENLVFMGSNVISGSALGVVIAVGNNTLFGDVARELNSNPIKSSFDIGIQKTSYLLIKFMSLMAPTIIVINGFTKCNWLEALLFGLSVAVGLTPEMLPVIVTTNLVRGSSAMAKKGTIIKNLNSIQNFGAIDILCTDKTGTLTKDKIVLEYHLNIEGNEDSRILRHAYLNSYYQTGLKNLMDIAIINATNEQLNPEEFHYEKVDEIPFDFHRRRMTVVVESPDGKTQMITKGAMEEMINISTLVDYCGKVIPLDETMKIKILNKVNELNKAGFRVLGISQKSNPRKASEFSVEDEKDMVLMGYLAFLDPPKESTFETLNTLKEHGIKVKVFTGDNALVTKSVCKQVGLNTANIIKGSDITQMNELELSKCVEENNIFVKLNPNQKAELTKILRKNGHTVAFLGDGINDAPAMKVADVGISVDTAVDIAKESADVILLEKDLNILEQGIVQGRTTFGNIMKYIKATVSSNFGNMFSVLIASTFLPFLPMMPLQILFLNLIYDISCISIPWDRMDKEYIDKPKAWKSDSIGKFMMWFGPTSSIFDITTYLIMYFIICPTILGGNYHSLGANGKLLFVALFNAGWFVESLWTQTFVLHALRTPKIPFIQSNASKTLTLVTALGILIGSILPYSPIGKELGLTALPFVFWLWLMLTMLCYLTLVTFVKKRYVKKYGELL
ncbi:MAG: magnesium-translocating P-type ATPase [Lachnospiraceae bacterium]|jgi:Mg2+-importing ATPase|nr:magnesium-translocating P-type ATPase [Lachnospiraceae bacterium]